MNSTTCRLAAVLVILGCTIPATAADAVEVNPERANGVYAAGETVRFVITGPADKAFPYTVLRDAATKVKEGEVTLDGGRALVECSLDRPGTLLITVGEGRKGLAQSGAAVDPFRIAPAGEAPADFDEFWADQKKKLAAVKPNTKLTPQDVPETKWGPAVETFEIQMDCLGGKPVSGYFARPAKAKPKSLPAVLYLHSAGIRSASRQAAWNGAKRGALSMDINAHGLPNGKDAQFYKDLGLGELKGYPSKGIGSPETFYFLGMYLRMVRAIDFLTSQPEWDGQHVIVQGSSQGGGQSLVIAGLDPRVTELRAQVPAFCDYAGPAKGRKAGWPGSTGKTPAEKKAVSYYDACFFAARSKAKATVIVGLCDTTCPATGVIAAYNQLKGPKTLVILPMWGHGAGSREKQAASQGPEVRA